MSQPQVRTVMTEPMEVIAIAGEVSISSQGHGSFTPEAALESAERLRKAAEEAIRQRASGADPASKS